MTESQKTQIVITLQTKKKMKEAARKRLEHDDKLCFYVERRQSLHVTQPSKTFYREKKFLCVNFLIQWGEQARKLYQYFITNVRTKLKKNKFVQQQSSAVRVSVMLYETRPLLFVISCYCYCLKREEEVAVKFCELRATVKSSTMEYYGPKSLPIIQFYNLQCFSAPSAFFYFSMIHY